ncbi:hypothetical protein BDR04DRAFT_997193, partial [Suillus decipiens]
KLEEYGFALSDASKAIEVDPKYAKAFYRRATCYLQIAKPQLAVADFKKVVALEPRNTIVQSQLTATQKLVRRIEFEKAIEVEGEKNPVERCHEIIAEGQLFEFPYVLHFHYIQAAVRSKKPMLVHS